MSEVKLNLRQRAFCDEYLINGHNAYQAAIKAGYAHQTAKTLPTRWLRNPPISVFINNRIIKVQEKAGVTFDWKVRKLQRIVDAFTPDDDELPTAEGARVAIAAMAELNKMQGDLAAEKRVTVNIGVDSDVKKVQQLLLEKHRKEF